MRGFSLYQFAHAVWNLIAVGSRTVTAATVSDKTGYSLTVGSYAVRASSTQHISWAILNAAQTGDVSISTITLARAGVTNTGGAIATNTWSDGSNKHFFQSTSSIRAERDGTTGQLNTSGIVIELT